MTKLPNPNTKESKISSLVFDKFPHLSFSNKYNSAYDLNECKALDYKEETRKAEEYKEKISSYSPKKLDDLYNELISKRKTKHEIELEQMDYDLFHNPAMNAIWEHWHLADYWTVDECIALTLGKDPRMTNLARVQNYLESPFAHKYSTLFELVSRSVKIGTLQLIPTGAGGVIPKMTEKKIIPTDYVKWAIAKNISLPKELLITLEKSPDYKALLEDALKRITTAEETNLKLTEENKNLREEAKRKEDQRVVTTLYKILCGLVLKHYGTSETNRVSMIKRTIFTEAGIDMDEKTIRSHVDKSLEEDQSKKE